MSLTRTDGTQLLKECSSLLVLAFFHEGVDVLVELRGPRTMGLMLHTIGVAIESNDDDGNDIDTRRRWVKYKQNRRQK